MSDLRHERLVDELALVLDASTLGQRFTILAVCVVIRVGAISVAWKVVEATQKGAWKPHWTPWLPPCLPPCKARCPLTGRSSY